MECNFDAQLIERYLHGDRAALDVLIRRYLHPVYRFAWRYTHNEQDTEEIVQEAFVRMWRNLRRFDSTQPFSPWLLQIAKHAAIDLLRKRVSTSPIEELDVMAAADTNAAPWLGAALGRLDDARVLTVALERLPDNDRIVLILHYRSGLTFREIGEALNESLHTVKSRHRRAVTKLRQMLTRSSDGLLLRAQ